MGMGGLQWPEPSRPSWEQMVFSEGKSIPWDILVDILVDILRTTVKDIPWSIPRDTPRCSRTVVPPKSLSVVPQWAQVPIRTSQGGGAVEGRKGGIERGDRRPRNEGTEIFCPQAEGVAEPL